MPVIRTLWRLVTGLLRALFRTVTGLLLVAALVLNLGMVLLPAVFNAVSGLVWAAVSVASSATANRRATRATTAAALRADADELTRTRVRLATAEADLETTRARVATVEGDNRRLTAERDRARTRVATLETDNQRLTVERTRAQTQLADERAAHRTTRSRLGNVEANNTQLRKSLQAAESRLDDLAARQARTQARARTITRRMQTRSARMLTRNTGSTFVEALPFVGGATVFGTLAWDVYDTCAQLADLRELETTLEMGDDAEGDAQDADGRWCGMSREDILGLLVGMIPAGERACVAARIETQTLNPAECAAFPADLPVYDGGFDTPAPAIVDLPLYD